MSKGAFNASVIFGDPLTGAALTTTVTVYRSFDSAITSLWSDREGTTAIANPFTLTELGKFKFYANPNVEYDIVVSDGSSTATFSNVLIKAKEQPGRVETGSFTIAASDADQFIETTGATAVVTVPTDAQDTNIKDGFMVHGHHQNAANLTFAGSATILVNSDLTDEVPENGCWTLMKSRGAADTWLLFGYLDLAP